MRMRSIGTAVLAAALALTGLGATGSTGTAVPQKAPRVIVALADTGVNPYHQIYYRPENTAHPCEWVEGFDDCSVPALPLSIGEYDTWEEAVAADADVWASAQLHQWYWIPKTNIIGAVCEGSGSISGRASGCILDEQGHGTGTSSSVLTENPDALLLIHQGNSGAYDLETAPVIPDIESHSWSAAVPLPLQAAGPVFNFCEGSPPYDEETLFFLAAGNEAPFPTFVDCPKVPVSVQVVGGGYPGQATTSSWWGFDYASWYCRPTADHESIHGFNESSCGTSFAAPTVAGAASRALLELRRREGYVGGSTVDHVTPQITREQFVDALHRGATYDVDPEFPNDPPIYSPAFPLPEDAPWLFWGYGWIDATRVDAIVGCALGSPDCPEIDPQAQQWHDARTAIREAQTFEPLCCDVTRLR